jgi:hypothetical protein
VSAALSTVVADRLHRLADQRLHVGALAAAVGELNETQRRTPRGLADMSSQRGTALREAYFSDLHHGINIHIVDL